MNNVRTFNILDYTVAFDKPQRMTTSAWHEHIPFAFVLVQMLKPRLFVELGTHWGDSYCAFCQAVEKLMVGTRCYAIDTWEGDPHAVNYGDEVYENLRRYHDLRYGAFSSLLRSTFEKASHSFSDKSIDLLHIDGFHTYEAVRNDYETWMPKMSERGVILFHDTSVRERDFGVWRFWEEASRDFPSFEFRHGNGLGILGVGKELPMEILKIFQADPEEKQAICRLFAFLGHHHSSNHQLKTLLDDSSSQAEILRQQLNYVLNTKKWKIMNRLEQYSVSRLISRILK